MIERLDLGDHITRVFVRCDARGDCPERIALLHSNTVRRRRCGIRPGIRPTEPEGQITSDCGDKQQNNLTATSEP